MDIEVQILSGYGIDAYKNPFSVDALGWMFISSFIQGLVFFTLRLLLNKFLTRKIRWGKQRVKGENKWQDKDVQSVALGSITVSSLQITVVRKKPPRN